MCVVSNMGDQYRYPDQWPWRPVTPLIPYDPTIPTDFLETWKKKLDGHPDTRVDDLEKRIKVLEELLEAGKKYDAESGQPDCELDEKIEAIKRIAEQLGVKITFPGEG